jgi:diacylglycerol kinase (ATP)
LIIKGVTVRAIVCGGDGTVMWVVDEMIANHIDIANCPIGTVPFGTGNDFARVTGWGGGTEGKVLGDKLTHLKKLVSLWVSAGVEDFDIWDIKIYTYEVTYIIKLSSRLVISRKL